jgi:hypothetical protein
MVGTYAYRIILISILPILLCTLQVPNLSCQNGPCYGSTYELKQFSDIQWTDAKPGMKLYCDYIIKTGNDGNAVVEFGPNIYLTLNDDHKLFYPSKMIIQPNDYFLNRSFLYVNDETGCMATVSYVGGDVKVSKNSDVFLRCW